MIVMATAGVCLGTSGSRCKRIHFYDRFVDQGSSWAVDRQNRGSKGKAPDMAKLIG